MENPYDYWQLQPTKSSCGPTSIKIACNLINKHREKTPLEIFNYCSNQLKGSPWWRMLEMLDKLNINYSAHSHSFEELVNNMKDNIVIVSIAIEGLKHWCVLYKDFIFDPELGIYTCSNEFLKHLTGPRNYFHICVDTAEKNTYNISESFRLLDQYKMVLVGEANEYFNKNMNCIITKNLLERKDVFAYNKEGLLMYV